MFDVMRDLTRVGVDPVQAVVPPNILVNIPQPAPLNDVLYKLGYDTIDFAFMRMREDADDLWTAADVVAEVVFGLDFVRATHKWFGLGTALELYALWSVGYNNPIYTQKIWAGPDKCRAAQILFCIYTAFCLGRPTSLR